MSEKLTEARIKANQKWDNKNKDRAGYLRHKARAKSFIVKDPKTNATTKEEYLKDLLALKSLLDEKIKNMQ